MQRCPFCGKELPDSARFCPRCGHNLEATTIVKRKADSPSTDGQSLDISSTPTGALPGHQQEEERAQGNNPAVSTLIEEQPTQTLQDTDKEDEGLPPVRGVSEDVEQESEVSAASVSQQDEASEPHTPLSVSPAQDISTPTSVPKRGFPVRWLIIGLIALLLLAGSIGGLVLLLRSHTAGTATNPGGVPTQSSQKLPTLVASVCPSATVSTSSSCLATQINATPIIIPGTVDLTFSGAVIGHMTVTRIVACGPAQSIAGGMQYYVALFGTISRQQYAFTFSVYPYTNPTTYTNTVTSFFGPSGEVSSIAKWRSAPNLGVNVTVNSDGKSGSLNIGYVSSADHSTAHVIGSWKCG